jgi:urease accessory protein
MAIGRLSFERAGGATAVSAAYAESPLRFLTPRNHGTAAWAFTSALGGGLLDGDSIELTISVGAGARAFVSSQGPTRVFRSPRGCVSEVFAQVGEGAALVLAPEPAACFGGARFEQRTEIDLAAGASLLLWDVLSMGRERWGFARCRSSLAVRRAGRALLDEAWLLDPAHGNLRERFGRFQAIATFLLVGPLFSGMRAAVGERIESRAVLKGAPLIESASPLGEDALVVRLAAESVQELLHSLRAHLPSFLGDDPWRRDASDAA